MKKLFFLVLLTPLIQAEWGNAYNYSMRTIVIKDTKYYQTRINHFCIVGNIWMEITKHKKTMEFESTEKNVETIAFEKLVSKKIHIPCDEISKEDWEKDYKK